MQYSWFTAIIASSTPDIFIDFVLATVSVGVSMLLLLLLVLLVPSLLSSSSSSLGFLRVCRTQTNQFSELFLSVSVSLNSLFAHTDSIHSHLSRQLKMRNLSSHQYTVISHTHTKFFFLSLAECVVAFLHHCFKYFPFQWHTQFVDVSHKIHSRLNIHFSFSFAHFTLQFISFAVNLALEEEKLNKILFFFLLQFFQFALFLLHCALRLTLLPVFYFTRSTQKNDWNSNCFGTVTWWLVVCRLTKSIAISDVPNYSRWKIEIFVFCPIWPAKRKLWKREEHLRTLVQHDSTAIWLKPTRTTPDRWKLKMDSLHVYEIRKRNEWEENEMTMMMGRKNIVLRTYTHTQTLA